MKFLLTNVDNLRITPQSKFGKANLGKIGFGIAEEAFNGSCTFSKTRSKCMASWANDYLNMGRFALRLYCRVVEDEVERSLLWTIRARMLPGCLVDEERGVSNWDCSKLHWQPHWQAELEDWCVWQSEVYNISTQWPIGDSKATAFYNCLAICTQSAYAWILSRSSDWNRCESRSQFSLKVSDISHVSATAQNSK